VSDIYSPLYDELAQHQQPLEKLWIPWTKVWDRIEMNHRSRQLDSAVRHHMERYYGTLKEYTSFYISFQESLLQWLDEMLQAR
jgi:hypothetical protein